MSIPKSGSSEALASTVIGATMSPGSSRLKRRKLKAGSRRVLTADHGSARVELVQLTSFGCGIDAITADQMRELMRAHGKLYTLIKMDESNALASTRIRIRSLLAVGNADKAKSLAPCPGMPVFSKRDAGTHTILVPQMAPLHLPFITAAIAGNSHWLDALDGGHWQYGDDSYPEAGVTYFAGTFVRHPLALASAKASAGHSTKPANRYRNTALISYSE